MYNPSDWYWLADDGRLYSSKKNKLVAAKDKDYVTWLETPFLPTRWPQDDQGEQTDSELAKVLLPHGIAFGGLGEIKTRLKAEVDKAAEVERLKYITPGTGQAMTYQQKVAEAQGYIAATNPKLTDYPLLASEVGITAPTLSEVAETVLVAYRQWQQIGAMIEAIRLGAKRDIDAAGNANEAHAVVNGVTWVLF